MDNKNGRIRQMLVNGITEDEFIERFEEIMEFIGFKFFNPADVKINKLASLDRMWMPSCLEKIYRMNPSKNNWANYEKISERLKLFLKLKGEDV
jgi:hypothetical protein